MARLGGHLARESDVIGHLTLVRMPVIDAAGHWLGNLFQRLRAVEQDLRAEGHVLAHLLEQTTNELDEVLHLLLDYVSPLSPKLDRVPVAEVLVQLEKNLRGSFSLNTCVPSLAEDTPPVLVDTGTLATMLGYLPAYLHKVAQGDVPLTVRVSASESRLCIVLSCSSRGDNTRRSAAAELYEAVLVRLVEALGGKWGCQDTREQKEWLICLPLQR